MYNNTQDILIMIGLNYIKQKRQARANFSFEFSIQSKWKNNIHQQPTKKQYNHKKIPNQKKCNTDPYAIFNV